MRNFWRNFLGIPGSAEVEERGNGRFLKKAPQKLHTVVAGLWGWYGMSEKSAVTKFDSIFVPANLFFDIL